MMLPVYSAAALRGEKGTGSQGHLTSASKKPYGIMYGHQRQRITPLFFTPHDQLRGLTPITSSADTMMKQPRHCPKKIRSIIHLTAHDLDHIDKSWRTDPIHAGIVCCAGSVWYNLALPLFIVVPTL